MVYVIILAAVIIFAIVLYDKPLAKLAFKDGDIVSSSGTVDPEFQLKAREIGRKQPFSGQLKIYKSKQQYRFKFTKNVPNKIRHELRNALTGVNKHHKGKKR